MDKYVLGQSGVGRICEDHREVRLDLQLENNIYSDNVLIYGYITDSCGKPIHNACISFLDKNNSEIGSVYSSDEGFYSYGGIKFNSTIKIIVKKAGYRDYISNFINISIRSFELNISLNKLPAFNKTIISGHLADKDNNPLGDILIYLLTSSSCGRKRVYKATNSNPYGQFVFTEIPKGKYEIFINDANFDIYRKSIEICKTDKIIDVGIKLSKRNTETKITGQIQDNTGRLIPYATVVLYRVEENKLIPVNHTVSDKEGRYIFTNIPYNSYIVKAKR